MFPDNNKRKIVNDPVYGFINIPSPILYDLMEHPCFQRLRRIRQLGLTCMVYPGANHTRFQHALGAMHLMEEAIKTLRAKGIDIDEQEAEAALIAILLHDVGHGPCSHALERVVIEHVPHETLSLLFMRQLNREFGGKLDMAIEIFQKRHPKKFLCRLVSGQLDVDRLDYLRRDSFFTGVTEGVIGSDRIIKMLHVHGDELVIEAKGVYSIEKFLLARRLMYWQVYLHKTVIAADRLLLSILQRAKQLIRSGEELPGMPALLFFLREFTPADLRLRTEETLAQYAMLDDADITVALKMWAAHGDAVLSRLSSNLLNRELFRIEIRNEPFDGSRIEDLRRQVALLYGYSEEEAAFFVCTGSLSNHAYNSSLPEESILVMQDGKPVDITEASDLENLFGMSKVTEKYFLCYPKETGR
ncbi:MAG: HD domain-containing protein [Bacteroidales bacterium]|jgi:HD superfamily phosphohydrolase|nr:HD domain-containing protein [Bacteroidales bacterium]